MELLFYITGLVLLCTPSAFLSPRRHALTSWDSVLDKPGRWLGTLHFLQVIDLLRAVGGILLLQLSWNVATGTTENLLITTLLGLAALIGLTLQMIFWRDAQGITAPIAYLIGLLIILGPWTWVVPAVVLGIATAIALRNLWGFFGATATALVAAGVGLGTMSIPLSAVLAGLCVAAPALSFVTTRELKLVTRRPTTQADPSTLLRDVAIPAIDRSRMS